MFKFFSYAERTRRAALREERALRAELNAMMQLNLYCGHRIEQLTEAIKKYNKDESTAYFTPAR